MRSKEIQARNNVRRYGITVEDFQRMYDEQGGVCAICHRLDPSGRRLCIDHCHDTGKIRGLLCCVCNIAISSLETDADWAIKALQYLESNAAIIPTVKTKAYTPEWKEKVRQSNLVTWADETLRKKHEHIGRAGAKKQWAQMTAAQKSKQLDSLQTASARYKASMTEEQKKNTIDSLRAGHRRCWNSLSEERRKEIASRVTR